MQRHFPGQQQPEYEKQNRHPPTSQTAAVRLSKNKRILYITFIL